MTSPSVSSKRNSPFSTAEKPLERKTRPPQPPLLQLKKETKPNFQQILNQKCITFLFMMARRQRIVNQQKHLLFSHNKINLLKLFNFIDCENAQQIDSDNLAQYFVNSSMIAMLYGNAHSQGKIRFCDFVRMLVPLQYNIELIERYQEQSIDLQLLEKVIKIFKIMSDNQKQNIQQLSILKKELKLDSVTRLFESLFLIYKTLDYPLLSNLFAENNLTLSDFEVSLIFFKLDKNGDGILEPLDFQGYC